jgi:hypothetical protein
MKRILTSVALVAFVTVAANAADSVYINEVLSNGPGTDTGNEYFELRGTPNMSLAGYYLLSIEGQVAENLGDVNQFFNLGGESGANTIGANGYFFVYQTLASLADGPYTGQTDPNAPVVMCNGGGFQNTTFFYRGDGYAADLENKATTILLVKVESGYTAPQYTGGGASGACTDDLDTDDDGILDLPAGWTVVDSVGIMDGAAAVLDTDRSYGFITFRAPVGGSGMTGEYHGTNVNGNVIDVPPPAYSTTSGTFHVGRKGESTGTNSTDWVGSTLAGAAASPLSFTFLSSSDSNYTGRLLSDMVYGGTMLSSFSITNVTQTVSGPLLEWSPAGVASNIKYGIYRGTDVANKASYTLIETVMATTSFTDTAAPAGGAFYYVLATP